MNVAKVYHVNRVRIFRSGCLSCALCPEHRLGVCSWGVWKWTSVQDQFCSWEPLPSALIVCLPSHTGQWALMTTFLSILHFISLSLGWIWLLLLLPVLAQFCELFWYLTCFYSACFLPSQFLTALAFFCSLYVSYHSFQKPKIPAA